MTLSKNAIMNTLQWRKWFLLIIFAVCRRFDAVDGLKCYCNSERCPNATCETDGYCFASASIENGAQKLTYQNDGAYAGVAGYCLGDRTGVVRGMCCHVPLVGKETDVEQAGTTALSS